MHMCVYVHIHIHIHTKDGFSLSARALLEIVPVTRSNMQVIQGVLPPAHARVRSMLKIAVRMPPPSSEDAGTSLDIMSVERSLGGRSRRQGLVQHTQVWVRPKRSSPLCPAHWVGPLAGPGPLSPSPHLVEIHGAKC